LERLPADSESVGLLSLENSVSRPGGTVIDMEHLQQLSGWARERGLPVHLDGARLLNACIELHVEAPTMAACADSVSLALTKGLSAPCGALLAGPAEFVERARRHRWMLGGNWKQGGVVAAACLTALTSMPERLRLDHDHARRLAEGLNSIEGLAVDVDEVVTNILYMATDSGFDAVRWCELVARAGVTVGPFGSDGRCRWVTHPGLTTSDIDRAIHVAASAAQRTRTCTD
jgi:threonine aldolase